MPFHSRTVECREQFFQALWSSYIEVTPQAARIRQLFEAAGEKLVNDHVAFRTFDCAPIAMDALEPFIIGLGYHYFDSYSFPNKHLRAKAFLCDDPTGPRIFLSELICSELSSNNRRLVERLCASVNPVLINDCSALYLGRAWPVPSWQEYQQLLEESEYAAWLSVMGLRANHFTVSVNHLNNTDMHALVKQLQGWGFELNAVGGILKGEPKNLLVQCSTLADQIELNFAAGDTHTISSCYYEFARRYQQADGTLYQGFVAANADKIFHSTDQKH